MNEENQSNTGGEELQRANEVRQVVRGRIDKLNSSFKMLLIVGLLVNAVIVGYFSWMYSALKEVLEPKGVADMISMEISDRIPEIGKELETHLTDEAPEIVNSLKMLAINESAPLLRELLVAARPPVEAEGSRVQSRSGA